MANDPLFSAQSWADAASGALALEPGVLLAEKYRLIRPAGFGGMGAVWVARNEATAAEVAVKVLVLSREGVDDEAIARFRREAHAAAQLYHRGIVRIFDLVELNAPGEEMLVLVMELLRGDTLASEMDRRRTFTVEATMGIAFPLLSALAHAHAQGIVHRDLKPENVFLAVDPDGHVTPKILDFGISKLLQPQAPKITTDGAMLGTPNYMSPEQARGRADVDARSDVFAAGILLYEMLAGENPFTSGSYHSVVAAILERDPTPIEGLSDDVWRVIKRSLEKPAALRYADASELSSALKRATQTIGLAPPDASGPYPSADARSGSVGDRSVPPAGFREPEATIPSMFKVSQRKSRFARVSIAATAVAAALVVGAIAVRVGRAHEEMRGTPAPPVSAVAAQAAPAVRPLLEARPSPSAAASSGSPDGATAAPLPASATPPASAAPAPPPASPPHPPRAVSSTPRPRPSAAPAPAPGPTSSAPSKPSTVVRDPGF